MRRSAGFTLIEMLAVLAVMAVLWALTVPAFTGVLSAQKLTAAAAEVSGTVSRSVLFARSQNTYVWLHVHADEDGVILNGFFSRDGTDDSEEPTNITSAWDTRRMEGVTLGTTEGTAEIVRPAAEFLFPQQGAWLVISPIGEVEAVAGSGDGIPESDSDPVRWVEISLREIGVADASANAAIVQVAGLTGQTVTYRP